MTNIKDKDKYKGKIKYNDRDKDKYKDYGRRQHIEYDQVRTWLCRFFIKLDGDGIKDRS